LVIEDSKLLRRSLEISLSRAGYNVVTANDGQVGLEIAKLRHPDAILLDLLLPIVSGIDVLKSLKIEAETKHIPVLVLSGLSHENSGRLKKDGASAYIEKQQLMLASGSEPLLAALRDLLPAKSISVPEPRL
jgi:DNA-binding response OmpR family regulator